MPFFQVYFNSHHRKRRSWSKFKVTSADPYKKFFISLKKKKTHKNLPQIGERRKKILRKKNQSSRGCGFSLLPGKEKASNLFKIPHRLVFQQVLEVPILTMLTHVTNKSREILHTQSTVTADKNTKKKKEKAIWQVYNIKPNNPDRARGALPVCYNGCQRHISPLRCLTVSICWHIARLLVWLAWPCVSCMFDLWPVKTTYVALLTPFGKITLFMTKRLCFRGSERERASERERIRESERAVRRPPLLSEASTALGYLETISK